MMGFPPLFTMIACLLALVLTTPSSSTAAAPALEAANVTLTAPVKDSRGSMPLGNGDLGLNVWTEDNGDLLFYIGKTDAWLDNQAMDLVKVARVRVSLSPSPFVGGGRFSQTLKLRESEIVVEGPDATLRIWIDANAPVIRVETSTKSPVTTTVSFDPWRADIANHPFYKNATPDVVLPNENNRLLRYHRNENPAAWPMRDYTFGAWISGPGLVSGEGQSLRTPAPALQSRIEVVVLNEKTPSADAWIARITALAASLSATDLEAARSAHLAWWNEFWNRSWITVTGDADAQKVTRGYALQRFITACAGRGRFPIKFNGSIFVVENPTNTKWENNAQVPAPMSADERLWGGQYWVQNTRAMYWPRLAAGDFDLMRPLFRMYSDIIRVNEDAVKRFYNHEGSYIAECAPYWGGIPHLQPDMPGTHTIHYFSPALELVAMGLDYHAYTQPDSCGWAAEQRGEMASAFRCGSSEGILGEYFESRAPPKGAASSPRCDPNNCMSSAKDDAFLRDTVLPMARLTLLFYAQHFPRDASGRLLIKDANSAEAFWKVTNPLPDIAGLHWVINRLLALPERLADAPARAAWEKLRAELPPLPVGEREGKPSLIAYPDWSPAAKPHTPENPELYALYPFRHYGLGKPGLDLALSTFATRKHQGSGCWRQDAPQSALLGLADEARRHVVANFSASGQPLAFPAFWNHGFDYAPDQDNGGNAELGLQWMLLQAEGRSIRLLPAWPAGWDADFKLSAPYQTTVRAKVRDGKLIDLVVTPASRRADVLVNP